MFRIIYVMYRLSTSGIKMGKPNENYCSFQILSGVALNANLVNVSRKKVRQRSKLYSKNQLLMKTSVLKNPYLIFNKKLFFKINIMYT